MKRKPAHHASTTGEPAAGHLATLLDEKPIWAGLYEGLHDAIFPPKLPPLQLTSTPVPIADRMASHTNPWAFGTAALANAAILALLILLGFTSTFRNTPGSLPIGSVHVKDFTLFDPAGGGGGGGANQLADPTRGRLPRREDMPIVPAQVPVLDNPRLAIDPAISVPPDVKLPDNPSLPNIGMYNSTNVTVITSGPGTEAGIGTGGRGGVGPGKGIGDGPGSDRGFGDSIYRPGVGGVTAPIPLVQPEAEFSDEARRQKHQGVCMIAIIVDARGYPRNPRVTRSLGMGLDEKAIEAVEKYRFKPAMKDGKPVASMLTVEVNFRLY